MKFQFIDVIKVNDCWRVKFEGRFICCGKTLDEAIKNYLHYLTGGRKK